MTRAEAAAAFPVGSRVVLVEPLGQNVMRDRVTPPPHLLEVGTVLEIGGPFFEDSIWVDFERTGIECDPNWITPEVAA